MKYQFSQKIDSLQPSAIREILKATADPSVISFAAGNPARVIREITEADSMVHKPEICDGATPID